MDYGKICGGVGDGSVWHEGIEDEASMQELLGKAGNTVFTYNAEDYKTQNDKVAELVDDYRQTCEFFSVDPCAEKLDPIIAWHRRGRTSQGEALVLVLWADHSKDLTKIKRSTANWKKSLDNPDYSSRVRLKIALRAIVLRVARIA